MAEEGAGGRHAAVHAGPVVGELGLTDGSKSGTPNGVDRSCSRRLRRWRRGSVSQERCIGADHSVGCCLASGRASRLAALRACFAAGDADGEGSGLDVDGGRGPALPIPGTGDELDLLAGVFNGLLDRLHQEFERQKRFAGDASHQFALRWRRCWASSRSRSGANDRSEEYRACWTRFTVKHSAASDRGIAVIHGPRRRVTPGCRSWNRSSWRCGCVSGWPAARSGERAADLRGRFTTEEPAWVQVQPQLLGQLLENLVDNTCKSGAAGTPITVEVGRKGSL